MPSTKYRGIEQARSPFERVPGVQPRPDRPIRRQPRTGRRRKQRGFTAFREPIRSRRRFQPYAIEDPQEARAVPESMYPGSILERIVYKRKLYLYGKPGYANWTAQHEEQGGRHLIGGLAIDFVYWFRQPPLALEPQGRYWHGPIARFTDAQRAFILQGYGYDYAELNEDEVLSSTDEELDQRIQELVGTQTAPYREQFLSHRLTLTGATFIIQQLTERRGR